MIERQRRVASGRRSLLGAAGGGLVAVLAGCLGNGDDDAEPTADGDGSDAPAAGDGDTSRSPPPGATIDDHPVDEPVEVESQHQCVVCGMPPTNYANWKGQLAHEDGFGAFACTTGCLVAYVADPPHFGGPDGDIVAGWTTDYETRESIDAFEAAVVLDDEAYVRDPMNYNPRFFADDEDASAYVDDTDHLDADDVVSLDAVDREVAERFRRHHL